MKVVIFLDFVSLLMYFRAKKKVQKTQMQRLLRDLLDGFIYYFVYSNSCEEVKKIYHVSVPISNFEFIFVQAMKIALVVGFGVIVFLLRQRESGYASYNHFIILNKIK